MLCYVSLCEGLRAGAGSLSYIVHVDCCGLSTTVTKTIIIIIITHDIGLALAGHPMLLLSLLCSAEAASESVSLQFCFLLFIHKVLQAKKIPELSRI